MRKDAIIDGPYRYELSRIWEPFPQWKCVTWIMLNPSTADAQLDDPTIRKCIGFSKKAGYNGLYVVNQFAWRATDPKDLIKAWDARHDIIGARNERHIDEAISKSEMVVLAWGANILAPKLTACRRAMGYRSVLEVVLRAHGRSGGLKVVTLGLTKDGIPKHPLYIPYDQEFVPYYQ